MLPVGSTDSATAATSLRALTRVRAARLLGGRAGAAGRARAEGGRDVADELLRAIEVWIEVMRDEKAPAAARLQAADRIVERILGRVGEKLLVQKSERREVTVRYDVERLAEIVGELRRMGAIDGEVADDDAVAT
jgi:hypothetical protein